MGVIYIISVEKGAGKTTVCAGLAYSLHGTGTTAGYLKPHVSPADDADRDIRFMKDLVGANDMQNTSEGVRGRDVVFVEANIGAIPDDITSQTTYGAAREMKARVIAVEAWATGESPYLEAYRGFGENLQGVVLNKVPRSQVAATGQARKQQFSAAGIELLGVIPEDRHVLAVTVGELAEKFDGIILNNQEKAGELVENFMVGALIVDSGLTYFGRKTRKAAILRQDRPDMQLAALETPTACLVLGGSKEKPLYNVLQKAEQRGVPIIVTDMPVPDIAAGIDDILLSTPLHQPKKMTGVAELVRKNLEINVLA